MTTPTYKQQYDKIIQAYFKDEIKPMSMNFCFCGTLADKVVDSADGSQEEWESKDYTMPEFLKMEEALMIGLKANKNKNSGWNIFSARTSDADYEERLFEGMCAALEVLKKIHIERGEIIDEDPVFQKRKLQPVTI